ncbi:Na+/H+ antiporter subunit E [Isoptericola jiangsuensis]|uniref:Na+/H+ antiporter subunit E n=1 Tax=Isoptericola jiangsuensis TaxID=548579 RepID=UPI003AAA906C
MIARARRRLRRALSQWPAVLGQALVWVLLWGDLSWANVIGGAALGLVVLVVFPLPHVGFRGRVRPLALGTLVARFTADLVVASFQVAVMALRPGYTPHGAVVQVRLRNPDDVFLTITAVLSTLVPGTLVMETKRRTGLVYLHVLDIDRFGPADEVRRDVLALEERVLRAFAPDDVLVRCGLRDEAGPTGPTGSTGSTASTGQEDGR